jgi:7-cyano-7-deazaguanine synthase
MKTGILLSGGIDSACLAYWKKPSFGFHINYGQKPANAEREASRQIAAMLGIELVCIDIDCSSIGSGDLTDRPVINQAPVSEWWPYRNQLLLTLACTKGISYEIKKMFVGAVKTDKKHKDGRPLFFEKADALIRYQEGGIRIEAPGIKWSTLELIKRYNVPGSILGWTHSCHRSNIPCGRCNGCAKHIYIKEKAMAQ